MRLVVRDIDDFAATPADLSDVEFEGSPEAVAVTSWRGEPKGFTAGGGGAFDLSRGFEAPDRLTIEWDGRSANVDLVRTHYCAIDPILDWGSSKNSSPRALGKTELDAYRARALAEFVADSICGRTFRATLMADHAIRADGYLSQLEMPASEVLTPGWELRGDGLVRYRGRCPMRPSGTVLYVSGRDGRVPPDVQQAATRLAASYLSPSVIPDRAMSETTDAGFIRFTLASAESTGIPDVDAALLRHARTRRVVL